MIARSIRGVLAAAALVMAASNVANAQDGFGVSAGLANPMGDFGDAAEMGFNFGIQYTKPFKDKINLRFNGDLNSFGLPEGLKGSWKLNGLLANATYDLDSKSDKKPYLFGGLGFYQWSVEIDGFGSESGSDPAWNIGAGINFELGGRKLFAEARYVNIMTDGESVNFFPVVIGLRF